MLVRHLGVEMSLVQFKQPDVSDQAHSSANRDTVQDQAVICLKCPSTDVEDISDADDQIFRKALMALGLDPKPVKVVRAYKLGCDIDHNHPNEHGNDDDDDDDEDEDEDDG